MILLKNMELRGSTTESLSLFHHQVNCRLVRRSKTQQNNNIGVVSLQGD
jgi:hypothetical protein